MTDLDMTADIIDVRDIITRVEDLEETLPEVADDREAWEYANPEDAAELATLTALLATLNGMGGDEQWRGDWYPVTLIRGGYFRDYAQELAEDIGAINADASWPMRCIDWDQATRELRSDYTPVEIDGTTYWTR